MDEPAWAMSTPHGVDELDDELAVSFRRSSRLPLLLGLIMLLAVATLGTKLYMDWRARQAEQVAPPSSSVEQVVDVPMGEFPTAQPLPAGEPVPIAEAAPGVDTQSEAEQIPTEAAAAAVSAPATPPGATASPSQESTDPTSAEPATGQDAALMQTATPPLSAAVPQTTATADEPSEPVAVVATEPQQIDDTAQQRDGDSGTDPSITERRRTIEPAYDEIRTSERSRSDQLVGREAELAAERAWRERQAREAAAAPQTTAETQQERTEEQATSPAPEAESTTGDQLTPIQINQTLHSRRNQFRACFEHSESGPIEMRIRITPEGRVSFAGATDTNAERAVVACLVRELGRTEFDPFDGRGLNVTRTFTRVGP